MVSEHPLVFMQICVLIPSLSDIHKSASKLMDGLRTFISFDADLCISLRDGLKTLMYNRNTAQS